MQNSDIEDSNIELSKIFSIKTQVGKEQNAAELLDSRANKSKIRECNRNLENEKLSKKNCEKVAVDRFPNQFAHRRLRQGQTPLACSSDPAVADVVPNQFNLEPEK